MDKEEKIKRFIDDKLLQDAVYGIIMATFLKKKDYADVHVVAAQKIAIDLLQEAWKEMNLLDISTGGEQTSQSNVGL